MLERTPQMLPVLKEAGVIDSGGQGFLYLFEGMMKALSSEELSAVQLLSTEPLPSEVETEPESLDFQYCTETLIRVSDCTLTELERNWSL